jgi:hypothetical protein
MFATFLLFSLSAVVFAEKRPIIDTHIHYSHDAWKTTPPEQALAILREAQLKQAFVSSSSDEGTQKLYELAPDFIVPVLRPYRKRGETRSWVRDETVIDMLETKLAKNKYAGIGEFHVWGDDAYLPVIKAVVDLAKQHRLFLHAHSDAEAIDILFELDPNARILWAHSGFDEPDVVAQMLRKYPNLTADLAFRNEHARSGLVVPAWRELFLEFPDRIMVGTDTYTPERWYYVVDHANWTREWLEKLPEDVANKIAYENASALASWALGQP